MTAIPIGRTIRLGFDPAVKMPETFRNDVARTLYLLWSVDHLVPDGFHIRCLAAATRIEEAKPKTLREFVETFPTQDDYWTRADLESFFTRNVGYFVGDLAVTWELMEPADHEEPHPVDQNVLAAVMDERRYQNAKWPGYRHTPAEWILILEKLLGDARRRYVTEDGYAGAMDEIRQITATGWAAMEQCGAPLRQAK